MRPVSKWGEKMLEIDVLQCPGAVDANVSCYYYNCKDHSDSVTKCYRRQCARSVHSGSAACRWLSDAEALKKSFFLVCVDCVVAQPPQQQLTVEFVVAFRGSRQTSAPSLQGWWSRGDSRGQHHHRHRRQDLRTCVDTSETACLAAEMSSSLWVGDEEHLLTECVSSAKHLYSV